MSVPFQRPEIPDAIAQYFGLKGDSGRDFQIAKEIQPVIAVPGLLDTPYVSGFGETVGAWIGGAPVAAENNIVWARPGANVALQIEQLEIENQSAAVQRLALRVFSDANISAIIANSTNRFKSLASKSVGEERSSVVQEGSSAAAVGSGSICIFRVAAQSSRTITLPRPWVLRGDDIGVFGPRPALGLYNMLVNDSVACAFLGREFPIGG